MQALQRDGIECIVAPYEADAQLAYLSRTGYVHSIISEDSDLLPFGCSRVLFKMDGDGNGKEINMADLSKNAPLRFKHFDLNTFRQMCILSGCDYLASISGLGVKKAHGLLSKYRSIDRVLRFLKTDRNFIVPPDYEEAFERAERTFLHQIVYDHIEQKVRQSVGTSSKKSILESPTHHLFVSLISQAIPLTPYPEGMDASFFPFCGAYVPLSLRVSMFNSPFVLSNRPLPDDIAKLVASGYVDPYSYEPFELQEGPSTITSSSTTPSNRSNDTNDAMTMRPRGSLKSSGGRWLLCSLGPSRACFTLFQMQESAGTYD